jgi:hypothetical protein
MQDYSLDGLNKELDPWDSQYYMGEFRSLCAKEKMTELAWPARDYVVQIARFDPSKGIPNVVDSYAKFRELLKTKGKFDEDETPQLLICGHGAVDDPDASIIYDQVLKLINSDAYRHLIKDIIVMRLPPSDQRTVFFSPTRRFTDAILSSQCAHGQLKDRTAVVDT